MRPFVLCAVLLAVAGCGGGGEKVSGKDLPASAPATIGLKVSGVVEGQPLRDVFTCDGAGQEPALASVTGVPSSARELVLVVSDPDAPGGTFIHLTRFGLQPSGLPGGIEGENSAGKRGWTPPCPPEGDEPHRYVWTVYALKAPSGLEAGAKPDEVTKALQGDTVVARGSVTGTYGR